MLLLYVLQDKNDNIFPIAFALIEVETGGAWHLFLKNLRICVTSQPNLCLICNRHESIKNAYNNLKIVDNILHFHMCTILDTLHKTSCVRSKTKNFVKKLVAWVTIFVYPN